MHRLWLQQDIARQLALANTWLKTPNRTGDDEHADVYEYTGSCLRVVVEARRTLSCLPTAKVRTVGSLPVATRLEPAQDDLLTVTDGAVTVRAPSCPASLRASLEPHRPFTVRKYIIRYTPYGPPQERLGIAFFLAHPHPDHNAHREPPRASAAALKPIHVCDQVLAVLTDLRQTLTHLERTHLRQIRSTLEKTQNMPPRDDSDEEIGEDVSVVTQAAFGTQMPHRIQISSKTQTEAVHVGELSDPGRMTLLKLLNPSRQKSPQVHSASRSGESNTTQCLDIEPQTVPPPSHKLESPPAQVKKPRHGASHGNPSVALSAGGFTRTSTSHASDQNVMRPESRFQPTRMPPLYQESDTTSEKASYMAQKVMKETDGRSINIEGTESAPSSLPQSDINILDDPVPEWLKDSCYKNSCGRVPNAQVRLLSSWQKQREGTSHRFPDANIPIDVLKALKSFGVDAASSDSESADGESSDEEGGIVSNAVSLSGENDMLSDSDNTDAVSWSSSPSQKSPKRRFRHSPSLPPDSSLPSKNAGSQDASREVVSDQQDQHTAIVEPAVEGQTADLPSSPPAVHLDDDVEMEMELDIPRGLNDGHPVHDRGIQRIDYIVQVKETPLSKGKDISTTSAISAPAEGQQQTSSGTSKDTSSTSIVFSTYNDKSFQKGAIPDTLGALSKPYAANLPYNSQRDVAESEDEHHLYSVNNASSPHGEIEDVGMRDVHDEVSRSPGLSSPQSEQHQQRSPVSAGPSPPTVRLKNEVVPAKRKIEITPSKNGRRPSKRRDVKLVKLRSNSPKRDRFAELLREKEEHLRKFTEKARTQSIHSVLSEDAASAARSERLPVHREASAVVNDTPASAPHTPQLSQQNRKQTPHSTAKREHNVSRGTVPVKEADSLKQGELMRRPTEISPRKDMDVDNDNDDPGDSDAGAVDVDMTVAGANADEVVPKEPMLREEQNDTVQEYIEIDHARTDHNTASHVQENPPQRPAASLAKHIASVSTGPEKLLTSTQSVQQTIFEQFKHTYPAYTGDARHFLGQCKSMDKLDQQDKMVPKWQWDDFIIRNRTDYRDYANQCLDNGEDTEPYHRFYKDTIQNTLYTEGVMESRKTLLLAIEQLERKTPGNITKSFGTGSTAPSAPVPKSTRHKVLPTAEAHPKMAIGKKTLANLAMTEHGSPSSSPQKKRQSLPSAFAKRVERTPSLAATPSERPRQSLPGSSRGGSSSLAPRSSHAKPADPLSKPNSALTRPPSLRRSNSGPRNPLEPTGDQYRDFLFALGRVTSSTGSSSVGPPPKSSLRDRGSKR